MQTALPDSIRQTSDGAEADAILRKCVHCGFCLATCPTYQLLGDELDSPRGRIYLIKQALESEQVSAKTQLHLDRCLTCRACETTCPSGVEYGRLLDIGRAHVEEKVGREPVPALIRYAMRKILSHPSRVAALMVVARAFRPLLPQRLRNKIPAHRVAEAWPVNRHARRVLVLDGCVQPALEPAINSAAAQVLDRLGISMIVAPKAGCCGAIAHHLNAHEEALDHARRNIDAWWPQVEAGVEAIVLTASGCGPMVRDYAHLLRDDPRYAERATRISALTRDISEVVTSHRDELRTLLQATPATVGSQRIAFHSPCTLQHGLRLGGVPEQILTAAGFDLVKVRDGHLCCGSAGTYSLTQPELSSALLANKVQCLEQPGPDIIATANIGCLLHIRSAARLPIVHWIELIAQRLHRQ